MINGRFHSNSIPANQLATTSEWLIPLISTLAPEELLQHILTMAASLIPHDQTAVYLPQEQPQHYTMITKTAVAPVHPISNTHLQQIKETGQPLLITDPQHHLHWQHLPSTGTCQSGLSLPLLWQDDVIAILTLAAAAPAYFNQQHIQQLTPFCAIAAAALHQAQQHQQALSDATLHERQRLAKQLHDSISQTIFAANTLAELLPRIIDTPSPKVSTYLKELEILTRAAMAETRTLMIELHPQALVQTELSILLKQLCDAFTGHTRIPVTFTSDAKLFLNDKVQMACYQMTQALLHHIAQQAQATQVSINLNHQGETAQLSIQYDAGQEAAKTPPPDSPLPTLQEQARQVGAACTIHHQPGQGTTITVKGLRL